MRAISYILALLAVVGSIVLVLRKEPVASSVTADVAPSQPRDNTYYLDQQHGNNANDGRSSDSPWKTLSALRQAALKPGDQVLLHRGQTWRETLELRSSGTETAPITIGAYGEGEKPRLRGSDTFNDPDVWRGDGAERWYVSGLPEDPGTVVLEGKPGQRCATVDALKTSGDFHYDSARKRLYLFASENPATLYRQIEIPRREFVVGPLEHDHIVFRDLDFGHGRNITFLAWDGDHLRIEACDFVVSPGNHIQFQNGSNFGVVTASTFDDWNLLDKLAYAIQVIAEQSGPIDIDSCTFTASRQGGGKDHTAIMNDYDGWVRTVRDCRFLGNQGALADEGVVIWRPSARADTVLIADNYFEDLGGTAIIVQELNHYGATVQVDVLRNRIENVCLGDDLDKEGLRARQFGPESKVRIAFNLLNGTAAGEHSHVGIGVQEAVGIEIVNNLVRATDAGISLKRAIKGVTLRNNILLANRGVGLLAGATVKDLDTDYNCLFENAAGALEGVEAGSHSILMNPDLDEDFVPRDGSPCVDGGVVVPKLDRDLVGSSVPQGTAWDIGPIERRQAN